MAKEINATADIRYLRGMVASAVEAIEGLRARVWELESRVAALTGRAARRPKQKPRRRSRR